MQKRLIVALLVVIFTAPALAAELFYIIFDNTLKGCTIAIAEPTDMAARPVGEPSSQHCRGAVWRVASVRANQAAVCASATTWCARWMLAAKPCAANAASTKAKAQLSNASSRSSRRAAPRAIAQSLNKEGIPGPAGRSWGPSTIYGNWQRGTGILNNELYVGRLVWNRQQFIKDPDSGRRQARL